MVAITEDRATIGEVQIRNPSGISVAANTEIFSGTMVAVETAAGANQGFAVPVTASPTLRVVGVHRGKRIDNLTTGDFGAAGDKTVELDVFPQIMENSGGGDAIAAQHIGGPCYAVDNQTVALTDGDGSRPLAGTVTEVSTTGVRVMFLRAGSTGAGATAGPVASLTISTTDLTAAAVSQVFTVLANPTPVGIYAGFIEVPTAFTGGASSSATADVGQSSNPDLVIDAVDIFGAVLTYRPVVGDNTTLVAAVFTTAENIELTITSDVNVNLLTTGDLTVRIFKIA